MRQRSRLTSRQSDRFMERKQSRLVIEIILVLVIMGTFLFAGSRLTHLGALSIDSIRIFGADDDIANSLQAAVYKSLDGDYFGIFSKSNIFLYPKNAIEDSVKKASVRVDNVKVARDGNGTLVVSVAEKTPAAVICANLPDFSFSLDTCYFADATGLVYKSAPTFSASIYKKYFVPTIADTATTTDSLIGYYATSTDEFVKLQKFYSDIVSSGVLAEAILLKDDGEYELYVHNPNMNSVSASSTNTDANLAVIYFNNARPMGEEALNLVSFWKKMIDDARSKHTSLEYEYIDVRYGSNVFYRLIK